MSEAIRNDVTVIGAGLSGLTAAHLLQRSGHSVQLLEKSEHFGGAIRSRRENGYLIEAGPNSTLETTPLLTQLIRDLGIEDKKQYAGDAAGERFILRNGTLMPLPMSPPAFFATSLFSWRAKLRLFREPFIPPSPADSTESVADFVERRLGQEFLDYAINPFVAGVYAGDPAKLSVRAAFPKLFEIEQQYGSLIKGQIKGARERKRRNEESKQSAKMFSFHDGMQTLTDALAASLPQKQTGVEVTEIMPPRQPGGRFSVTANTPDGMLEFQSRAVNNASHAAGAALLTRGFDPELSEMFDEIEYPPVVVVVSVYRRSEKMPALDGFGFLIPQKEKREILGAIFSSTLFDYRCDDEHVLVTSFVGGSRQPENARLSEDAVIELAVKEQAALLSLPEKPVFVHATSWDRAIPQYGAGHLERMQQIEKTEAAHPGLYYCANYRGGISVGDCVKSAHRTAEEVLAELAGNKK